MTVFEWALPLRDDGRAGEPGRSRLHEPGGRVVIGPAQAERPRREDRIGYAAGLASGQHRVARLKSILKVLGSGRLRAQRRRGASRPTHLWAVPATGCAAGAAVTGSGTRGRFTGKTAVRVEGAPALVVLPSTAAVTRLSSAARSRCLARRLRLRRGQVAAQAANT
jgi:hypothetical protein